MEPLFSIIIPTYQRSNKLKKTLSSVLAQSFTNYEILVMDDGSTDNTREIVSSFNDSRINYNWQQNTGGPAKPRNDGIKIAKGDWIAFLDDDDEWTKDKLSEISKKINDEIDFIYHDYTSITSNTNLKENKSELVKSNILKSPKFFDLLLNGNNIGISTVVVRKKILLKVGGFNENVKMSPCADYNTWLKIARITEKFFYAPKNLGFYNIDDHNMSNQDMTVSKRLAVEEFLHNITNKQREYLDAKFNYLSGSFNYKKKNFEKSINHFLISLKNGSLIIKLKSLIRVFQVLILKILL